ncbi:MAG: OmpA family protein [Gammaproteobacteria bacterium]|nr:OmpA family protein [Gammaproteobacteria bacterium]
MRRIAKTIYNYIQVVCGSITQVRQLAVYACAQKTAILAFVIALFSLFAHQVYAVPPGTVITNTATANFEIATIPQARLSNSVDITTTVNLSPATISFLQYSPSGLGATPTNTSPTGCSTSDIAGPFLPLGNPTYLGMGTLNASSPLDLVSATSYHQGEPVFIQVNDANRNLNSTVRDTLVVTISSTSVGDQELLQLSETDVDTGEFVGYIQTVTTPVTPNDCLLAVITNELIEVSYTDIFDVTDVVSTNVLVDPFGIVFNSTTGVPVSGVTVTLINAATNLPAAVFGDDLVSAFPSTVVTGSTVTDAGSTVYNFGAGEYRFPSVAPGTYRLEVSASEYITPSVASVAQLQTLANAPFALDSNASFEQDFVLVVGPPLNVDIPIDPLDDALFVTKRASKDEVAIGDFMQYEITVANNRPTDIAFNTNLIDVLPTGFRYQKDSLQINGNYVADPNVSSDARTVSIELGDLPAASTVTIKYVIEVTSGAPFGSAVNSVQASDASGFRSNVAEAIVRVFDDLLSTRSFLIGTVAESECVKNHGINSSVNYYLESESRGNEFTHTLTIEKNDARSNALIVEILLPKLLTYKNSSATINNKNYENSVIQGQKLLLPIRSKNKNQVIKFKTIINEDYVGEFELRARLVTENLQQESTVSDWAKNIYKVDETISILQANSMIKSLKAMPIKQQKGISNVRLFLEDGRYVLTDERGMYHFEAIEPGTHVVYIDPGSIPDNLEIHQCVNNTRFSGDKYSQFVDIEPGLLWRANFYLREKQPQQNSIQVKLSSEANESEILFRLALNGVFEGLKNVRASIILPQGLEYVSDSSLLNGVNGIEPSNSFGTITYRLDDQLTLANNNLIQFVAQGVPNSQGEVSAQALITYDIGGNKNQRLVPVTNDVFYQKEASKVNTHILRSNFNSSSAQINLKGMEDLDRLISSLSKHKINSVRIIGHTDNVPVLVRANYKYHNNQSLSEARAKAVSDYLNSGLNLTNTQLQIIGKGDTQPIANNDTWDGRALNRRVEIEIESLEITKKKQLEVLQDNSAASATTIISVPNTKSEIKNILPEIKVEAIPVYDQTWLENADNQLEWLLPVDNANPEIPSVGIAIKHPREHKIVLFLNGKQVSALQLDSKLVSTDSQRMITRWRGVDVLEGDNQLEAITYNRDDVEQQRIYKNLHLSGQPVRAELVPEYSRLVADGRSKILIAVRFYDRWGYPARPGIVGSYKLSSDYTDSALKKRLDEQPLNGLLKGQTRYKIAEDGIAYIEIEPSTTSGKADLDFEFIDDRKQTISAWLKAVQKEWILVGLAEGTAGYNNISGNSEALDDNQHEDNLYENGRLAFYGKGQVKGEWLLTLAYDSERKERNSSERLFQTIDPDEYYTLYGDATEQQFDAASSRKLYLKIEKQQFYALFGDFDTGLTITELARYSRSMTGIKSEFEGNNYGFNAFAADTDQIFARDEIQGNGTSGLYRLSNTSIIINSEKIRLETRDRFQPQEVISEQQLNQFLDYSIDTVNGTLFFKQPVQSRDDNFNPIYIVADYEVSGSSDRQVTAGGRANVFSKDKKLEVGLSGITQGDTTTEGNLIGLDAKYEISNQTEIQIEVATSKTKSNGDSRNGTAYMAELQHNSEKADANLYFRRQASSFGLEQQSANNDGSKRYGVDTRYKINDSLNVNSEVYRDEVLANDNERTVATVELEKSKKLYDMAAGVSYAKDKLESQEDNDSVLATARASRYIFDSKLKVRADADIELTNDNSVDHPTRLLGGIDYRLNQATELFVEHEYTQGEDQDTNTSRVGTRLTPWSQATINSSVEQQSSENGERVFSNLGFVQGWQYSDNLQLDFSLDRSDTLRDPGGQAFNENTALASGTISEDFTAGSVGANYVQGDWSSSSRVEYRTSDNDIQRSLFMGYYREQATGVGMSLDLQVFDTDRRNGADEAQADINYSVAYRPDNSALTILNRFDLNYEDTNGEDSRIRTRKAINNLNLNYTVDGKHQFGAHWGIKYTLDHIDSEEYDGVTQLLGFQYVYDLHERVDLSLHGDVLYSSNADNYRYSLGPSFGLNVYKNMWLSIGYNLDGFEDEDFSSSEYTANGPYVKMRFKFDKNTVKGLLKK